MKKALVFAALHILFLTSVYGQTSSDSIISKKVAGRYGLYQNGNKLNKEQLTKALATNSESLKQLKSAKTARTFKSIFTGVGVGMIAYPIATKLAGHNTNFAIPGIGVGLIAASIPFSRKADRKVKGAIKSYNEGLSKPPVLDKNEIKISMSGNGVGLSLTF